MGSRDGELPAEHLDRVWPDTGPTGKQYIGPACPLLAQLRLCLELLKVLLRMTSERHAVASKVIATVDDLEKLAADDNADVAALRGWRRELFGEAALSLKHGKLALAIEKGRVSSERSSLSNAGRRNIGKQCASLTSVGYHLNSMPTVPWCDCIAAETFRHS